MRQVYDVVAPISSTILLIGSGLKFLVSGRCWKLFELTPKLMQRSMTDGWCGHSARTAKSLPSFIYASKTMSYVTRVPAQIREKIVKRNIFPTMKNLKE